MNRKKLDLRELQFKYRNSVRDRRFAKGERCPPNCPGRIINRGNCTEDNCILLYRKKKALAVIMSELNGKKRIRKYSSRDKRILSEISPDFKFRNEIRPLNNKILRQKGYKVPRLVKVTSNVTGGMK